MNERIFGSLTRSIEPRDAGPLLALARTALHSEWTEPFVQWKYFKNPAGRIHGCCIEMKGELVGFYGNAPLRIKVGDQIVSGTQALDGMVAASARRQGLFVKMGDRVHAEMAEAGVRVSYGIPNPISRAGLVKHMGWDYPGEIPRFVRILDPLAAAKTAGLTGVKARAYSLAVQAVALANTAWRRQASSTVKVRQVDAIDGRFEGVWDRAANELPIAVVRDAAYLTWRYVDHPLTHYTILVAEAEGTLRGYAVLSHRLIDNGIMALAEMLTLPGDEEAGLSLLAAATDHAKEAGATQVHCWMLPQHDFYTSLLRRSGFIYSPRRHMPGLFSYTTSLIVRLAPGSSLEPDPRQLGNWYLTMGDQDYF